MTGSISDKEQREIGREVHIFLKLPVPAFLIAGFVLFATGMLFVILIWTPLSLWDTGLGAHSMVVGSFFAITGLLLIVFGLFIKISGVRRGLTDSDKMSRFVFGHVSPERSANTGLVIFLVGLAYALYLFLNWIGSGYKDLPIFEQGFVAFILLLIGFLMITFSLFLSMAGEVMEKKRMQSANEINKNKRGEKDGRRKQEQI